MSYSRHDAILVTFPYYVLDAGFPHYWGPVPDLDVFRASLPATWRPLVLGPIISPLNGVLTCVFLPDGAPEGCPDSDARDERRRRFADLFTYRYEDGSTPFEVLHVRFGGDEPDAGVEPLVMTHLGPTTPPWRETPGDEK